MQFVVIRLKARTITTIYRILLMQLICNRLQNHVITTINVTPLLSYQTILDRLEFQRAFSVQKLMY